MSFKRLFILSTACKARIACDACRRPQNIAWRRSLASVYELPGGTINFDCPHGVPWQQSPDLAKALPVEPVPAEHDPAAEQRRLHQGGCCGSPSNGA